MSLRIFNYEIFKSKYYRFLARNGNIFKRNYKQTYIVEYRNYTEFADFVAVKDELKIMVLEGIVLL